MSMLEMLILCPLKKYICVFLHLHSKAVINITCVLLYYCSKRHLMYCLFIRHTVCVLNVTFVNCMEDVKREVVVFTFCITEKTMAGGII